MNDLFTARFLFPRVVNIIAPGPNGEPYWNACRDYVIAVNRAVLADRCWPHAWVVADKTGIDKDWWGDTLKYEGARIFSEKLWGEFDPLDGSYPDIHYTFRYERLGKHDAPIPKTSYEPMPGRFQGDGTTTGIAIEMAARFGAEKIILCGADFHGTTHWDGYDAPCSISDRQGDWKEFLPYMNSLIEWVRSQGIEIYSYSKTAIEVEQI